MIVFGKQLFLSTRQRNRLKIVAAQVPTCGCNFIYVPISAFNTPKTASILFDCNSCHQTFAGYPFVITYNSQEEALVVYPGDR